MFNYLGAFWKPKKNILLNFNSQFKTRGNVNRVTPHRRRRLAAYVFPLCFYSSWTWIQTQTFECGITGQCLCICISQHSKKEKYKVTYFEETEERSPHLLQCTAPCSDTVRRGYWETEYVVFWGYLRYTYIPKAYTYFESAWARS